MLLFFDNAHAQLKVSLRAIIAEFQAADFFIGYFQIHGGSVLSALPQRIEG